MSRYRAVLVDKGGLLSVVTLVIYAWIAPAHVVNGDNAEFATLGTTGGAAHPTGYPAYLLWLRLWSWLPSESPAHAAALATCLLTAIQVLVLHAACRAWGARPAAAAIVAALYVAGPVVLRVQSEAEAFAPHALVLSTVLWLSATAGPVRGSRRVVALGLVAGLGLAVHVTCVLIAPVGLLGAVRGVRESTRRAPVVVAAGVGALVLGLSTYAYLLITPETWASWGKVEGIDGLARHFLRMEYGGPGAFSPVPQQVTVLENQIALVRTIGRSYAWLPAFVGALALVRFVLRPPTVGETRVGWGMLAIGFGLAGPLLVSRFDTRLDDVGVYVVQRFHLTATLLLAPAIALGLDRVATYLTARLGRGSSFHLVAHLAPFLVLVGLSARALPNLIRIHSPAMEQGLRNMLRTLPPDAIVFGAPDAFHFGMGYMQGALGLRRDVLAITVPQLGLSYARRRIQERSGIEVPWIENGTINVPLCERALATGRPVFIDIYQDAIARSFPTYPYGMFLRVLPRGTPTPPVSEVFAINKALYETYEFGYPFPGPHDEIATTTHVQYTRTWHVIAEALAAGGAPADHRYAIQMALALAPGE